MNNYFKLFSAFLVSAVFGLSMQAQSINGYPDDAMYILKGGSQVEVTPRGCDNPASTSFKFNQATYDGDNIMDLKFISNADNNWSNWSTNPDFAKTLADNSHVVLTNTLGVSDVSGGTKYKVYHYTMTCTPTGGGTDVTRKVHFVVYDDTKVSSPLRIQSVDYTACGNPSTGVGYGLRFTLVNIVNNGYQFRKPNDAANAFSQVYASVLNFGDGDVQNGGYEFNFKYLDYYDASSNSMISGTSNSFLSQAISRKTGSPKANYNISGGLLLNVNSNTNISSAIVCSTDNVKLYWDRWDEFASNPEYANNYTFEWRKDTGGRPQGIGTINNLPVDQNVDGSGNYFLYFIAKGNSYGCPDTRIENGTVLSLTVTPFTKPTVLVSNSNNKICPDGTIDLSFAKTATMYDIAWTNSAGQVIGTQEKLTVSGADTYSLSFKDSSIKSVLRVDPTYGEVCTSPKVSQVISSYNKPTAPSITSNGKTKYCDYDFKSAVLSASTSWSEAAISSWKWTTTSTSLGTATDNTYTSKGFGTYNATYIDAFGCESTKSDDFVIAPIARPATPSIKLTGNAYNCEKNESGVANSVSFDLSSSVLTGSISYAWFNGSSAIAGATISSLKNYATSGSVSLTQTDLSTGCTSLNSPAIAIKFEANPTFTGASIVKSAYTLTANGFDAANTNDYVWKVGTSALGTSATQKISGTTAAEYTVAQFKSFTLNGSTIKCLSTAAKYSYVPDPEFSGIIAFPNPYNANTTSMFTIDVVDTAIWNGASVSIYDMMGRLVYSSTLSLSSSSAGAKFDLKSLGNGIYVLNLNASSGNTFQTKLVVNK